jgi:hypothetical protein
MRGLNVENDVWSGMIAYHKNTYKPNFYNVEEIEAKHAFSRKLKFMFQLTQGGRECVRLYFETEKKQILYLIQFCLPNKADIIIESFLFQINRSRAGGCSMIIPRKKDKIILKCLKNESQNVLTEMPEHRLRILMSS